MTFLGGAVAGLAAHEAGHLVFDVLFDADPGLKRVSFGPIPFFAITHEPVGPKQEFAIASAGFWVQHGTSEWLLTRRPQLRDEHAPFAKGLLAWNVLASVAYSGAAFARAGPAERDTRGMAVSLGVAEPWMGALILGSRGARHGPLRAATRTMGAVDIEGTESGGSAAHRGSALIGIGSSESVPTSESGARSYSECRTDGALRRQPGGASNSIASPAPRKALP